MSYLIAISSAVESDFGKLKQKILYFDVQPMTADRFIAIHLISIDSSSKLLRNSKIKY